MKCVVYFSDATAPPTHHEVGLFFLLNKIGNCITAMKSVTISTIQPWRIGHAETLPCVAICIKRGHVDFPTRHQIWLRVYVVNSSCHRSLHPLPRFPERTGQTMMLATLSYLAAGCAALLYRFPAKGEMLITFTMVADGGRT